MVRIPCGTAREAFGLEIEKIGGSIKVSCSHDGYKRLSGHPIHRRSWTLAKDTLLIERFKERMRLQPLIFIFIRY